MLELDKIHCGDNCDLLGQLPRECIDLVVTSPPYDDLRTYGGHSWDFFGANIGPWKLGQMIGDADSMVSNVELSGHQRPAQE